MTLLVPRPGVGGPAVRRLLLGSGQVYNLQALTCHLPQKSIRRKTQRKSSRLWGNGETVFFVRARGLNAGPTPPHARLRGLARDWWRLHETRMVAPIRTRFFWQLYHRASGTLK